MYLALHRSGGRVSEILNIRWCHVSPDGIVFVQGLKGSRSYLIDLKELDLLAGYTRGVSEFVFHGINRSTVYRWFRHLGIFDKLEGHKNLTVCHLPRHQKAQALSNMVLTDRQKADILGHQGTKSQKYYFRNYGHNK
jgi:integrase